MQFAVCRHKTVLSALNVHEAAVEFFNCEPIAHLGYEVIAVDDDNNIQKVIVVDGEVKLVPTSLADIHRPETAQERAVREFEDAWK